VIIFCEAFLMTVFIINALNIANLKRELFTVTGNTGTDIVRLMMKDICCIFRVDSGHIKHQVRTQNFSLGDPEAIYNICLILKIML
jgi:hypothetical protein